MIWVERAIIWLILAWAAYYLVRVIWRQLRGFLYPSEAGYEDCQGCPTTPQLISIDKESDIGGIRAEREGFGRDAEVELEQ